MTCKHDGFSHSLNLSCPRVDTCGSCGKSEPEVPDVEQRTGRPGPECRPCFDENSNECTCYERHPEPGCPWRTP